MTESTSLANPPQPQLEAPGERTDRRSDAFRDRVLGVAGYVGALHRGPRAVLRRGNEKAEDIPPRAFWDVAERYGIQERDEAFWLAILPLMVRHPHRFDLSPGRALAAAGVSAARIERWLRLDIHGARREVKRLLSHLKDGGVDWVNLAYLLRDWSDPQRRGFAREFFLSSEYRQRQTGDDA